MKIKHVMTTHPRWCIPEASATTAGRIMQQMNIGIVPVVEANTHRLLGVVTDRDLCLAVVAMDKHPGSVQVQECMTSEIVACTPDDDVHKAADLMSENQVRRIPVINQDGSLQGMVSMADIWQRSNLSSDAMQQSLKKVTEPTNQASKPRSQMTKQAA